MKYTVTNKSNTPHDLLTMKGRVVVLANDSVEVDLDDGTAMIYAEVAFFDVDPVTDSEPKKRGRPPKAA